MKIAITGGTGFIGRYIVSNLAAHGHSLNCWFREDSSREGMESNGDLTWIQGDLQSCANADSLIDGCDVVVHNAFWRPGERFQGQEGDIVKFVETNVIGTLRLIEAAIEANVKKFVYVSSCAVHEKILDDRPLDEAHPLWPRTHYGAHKAAIEKFVHSYGLGHDFDICAVRPTGVYGLHHRPEQSKWFDLVNSVVQGQAVDCRRGGKEVHAADVAESIRRLIDYPETKGEVFACYDQYISHHEVATLAKEISGSDSRIDGEISRPKNQIDNSKIGSIGMHFGGNELLKKTVKQLVEAARSSC